MIFELIEVDFYHLHINISTYNARSLEYNYNKNNRKNPKN